MHGLQCMCGLHVRVVVAYEAVAAHLPVPVMIGPHNNQKGYTKGEDLVRI